jgi:hypothetical protein
VVLPPKQKSSESPYVGSSPKPQPPLEEPPTFEELTPELMEDECLRGDFMIRWAAILLALLLGCTYLTETRLLVDIRSGEYVAGILPPTSSPRRPVTALGQSALACGSVAGEIRKRQHGWSAVQADASGFLFFCHGSTCREFRHGEARFAVAWR